MPDSLGKKRQSRLNFPPNCEIVALSKIDRQVPFLRPVPCDSKRSVKVHVLCPSSYQFDIIREEQRQCFEDIREVVPEKEKQEWAYHGLSITYISGFRLLH